MFSNVTGDTWNACRLPPCGANSESFQNPAKTRSISTVIELRNASGGGNFAGCPRHPCAPPDTLLPRRQVSWFLLRSVEFQLAATSRASGQFQVIRGWCCRRARAGVIVTSCYLLVPPTPTLPPADTSNAPSCRLHFPKDEYTLPVTSRLIDYFTICGELSRLTKCCSSIRESNQI